MSQSLLSEKKRRVQNEMNPKPNTQQQQPTPNIQTVGLTLPQVIQVVDRRLLVLEKFMKDSTEGVSSNKSTGETGQEVMEVPSNIKEVIEEFDKRYELLLEEIVNLKNVVINLQSYTMGVNKMLLEERNVISQDTSSTPVDPLPPELQPHEPSQEQS